MQDLAPADHELSWPPHYIVKRNRRAKNVVIRPTKKKTLIITIPHRFAEKSVPGIIEESKSWILKQFAGMPHASAFELPSVIKLKGTSEEWQVKRVDIGGSPKLYENLVGELVLLGRRDDDIHKSLLARWLCKKSEDYLQQKMHEICNETGLYCSRLSVRMKRTQWGSCSKDNEISLNAKLIFLPEVLISHVIIHELAHTVHHNHSKLFWQLVAKLDSLWRENKEHLKMADKYIPAWLEDN